MTTAAPSPWHAGELALQDRAGVRERLQGAARFIRDHMPDQHREFFATLPTLIVGALDAHRQPWASIVAGPPGFVQSPDPTHLVVGALPPGNDPVRDAIRVDAPIGLLGLEPQTRRRNRMNGTVVAVTGHDFTVEVDQSFGNCPQYIQTRTPHAAQRKTAPAASIESGASLPAPARALVESTDTLFIASAAADARGHAGAAGVDVSHRGGKPGFVRVDDDGGATTLTIPDFRGNSFFNTLGNIAANPRVGVLLIDYAQGSLLQIAGKAEIVFDDDQVRAYPGALRLIRVTVERSRWREGALGLAWSAPGYATQLEATGPWMA